MWLITGVNGLFGSALVRHWQGRQFAGVGRGACLNAYLGDYTYVAADLTDAAATQAALDKLPLTGIVHAAAMTAVDKCETARDEAWQNNVETTRWLAAYAARRQRRFVYISTDYVFDGEGGAPYREHDGVRPLSVYAATKTVGEWAATTYAPDALIVRTAIPFGDIAHVKKDFVRWLRTELEAKRPVRIVTDQISTPTWVGDLAAGVDQLITLEASGVWHVAGTEGLSRNAFAHKVAEVFHLDASLISGITTAALKQPARRPLDVRLNVGKAQAAGLQLRSVTDALQLL